MNERSESDSQGCLPHERRWRNYCVDRNLKDEWLERLNALKTFDLISICEGHGSGTDEESRRLPHFNLRLKERLAEQLHTVWSSVRSGIGNAVERCFTSQHVEAKFEYRGGFVKDADGVSPQEIAILKLSSFVRILDFDASFYGAGWFDENVAAAEDFDNEVANILAAAGLKTEQEDES
ncbi:MAG: hypothetical protein QUS14_05805 [Pyrinomonadaceae bacterium]|nr:hypothetical protein [Pyrinomonadaceae bacterium]